MNLEAQAAFDKRNATWDHKKWDYTEWEELYDEVRHILGISYTKAFSLDDYVEFPK